MGRLDGKNGPEAGPVEMSEINNLEETPMGESGISGHVLATIFCSALSAALLMSVPAL
jgi:hypothetical protein